MRRINPRMTGAALFVLAAIASTFAFASMSPASTPTITANAEFGVAYKGLVRRTYSFYWCLGSSGSGSGRPSSSSSSSTWTATLERYANGAVVVVNKSGKTSPVLVPDVSTGSIDLAESLYPLREIQVTFHVESTLGLDTISPWIDDAITVANALFQSERLAVYLTQSTGDAFTLASGETLDDVYLDAIPEPTDGSMHVYVGSLAAQMFQVGFTSTGVKKIAIAAGTQADVLAHELGHNLRLDHPSSPTPSGCLPTNLMVSNATSRTDITEGQIIRAHTHPESFIASTATSSSDVQTWLNVWESFWTPTVGI